MTKVITRYFDSAKQARMVVQELVRQRRFSRKIIDLFETADGLTETLTAAHVHPDTAKAYEKHMASGGAVLLVKAGYKPLGVAGTTREVTADMGAKDLGDLVEEVEVADPPVPSRSLSVLEGAPLILKRQRDPHSTNYHMADWPIPLISRRKPFNEMLFDPHARMADMILPLISRRKPKDNFAFPRHARMANFPIPLISRRKPKDKFAFPRHARMANFPIPLLSKRKPYTKSIIPRHARMATVPFPLLINGKTDNSLIPGGPRMANFPIPLISKREPADKFAFPRHARMANSPIPLLSSRKPYTKSIVPKHGHMADFGLPLVIKHGLDPNTEPSEFSLSKALGIAKYSEEGSTSTSTFSFSKMMGWPTTIRR